MTRGPLERLTAGALAPLRGHPRASDHLLALAFLHELHSLHWAVRAPSGPTWEDLLDDRAPGLGDRLDASLAAAIDEHPVQLADAFPDISFASIDDTNLRAACTRLPRLLDAAHHRADVLGLIYTATGSRRDQQVLGQFFTPTSLADFVAKLLLGSSGGTPPGAWILEPAAGAGALLLAAIEHTRRQHGPIVARSFTYIGIERDAAVARLARMNVVLADADEFVHIFCGDALAQPVIGRDPATGRLRHVTFDCVLANPPFNGPPVRYAALERRADDLPPLQLPERLLNRPIMLPSRGEPSPVPHAA